MKIAADKLKILLHALALLTVSLMVFFNSSSFVNTDNYGNTGFVVENYSNYIVDGQSFTAVIKPHSKNANSVRMLVVAPDTEYGEPVKISVYQDNDKTAVVEKYMTEAEACSGQYVVVELPENFSQGQETVLKLESKETDTAKAVRVAFGSAESTDVVNWYCADAIQPGTPAVSLVYNKIKTLPAITVIFAVCLLVLSLVLSLVTDKQIKIHPAAGVVMETGIGVALSVMTLNCIEILQYGNVLGLGLKTVLGNLFIIFGVAAIAFAVFSHITAAFAISSILMILFGTVNHYLIDFRGTTLLPTDIAGVFTAIDVVGGYTFTVDENTVSAVVLIIAAIFLCNIKLIKVNIKLPLKLAGKIAAFALGVVMIITPATKGELFSAELNLYRQIIASRNTNGFLMNFAINVPLLIREQPENYSPDSLDDMVNVQFTSSATQENIQLTQEQKPNILFVMNESFCDPRTLMNIKDSAELLPVIDNLKEDPNAHVGQLAVSVYGGGTSCTEYEVLTGFSMRIDTANYTPYMTYFNRKTPTIVWQLAAEGYNTSALHLASGRNWYRNTAYPMAGFERMIFLDEATQTLEDSNGILTGKAVTEYGNLTAFPTDKAGYDEIIGLIEESETPVFNYYITMQNHGGYSDSDIVYNVSEDDWSVYLKLMHESDNQLGGFIEELEKLDEPTVLVFFGDHWSYYDENKLGMEGIDVNNLTDEQRVNYYTTPYVVWSNCGYDFSSLPLFSCTSYLSAEVLDCIGMQTTPWQKFLLSWSEKVPAYTFFVVESNVSGEEVSEFSEMLNLLHYNALNDRKNYAENIFEEVH